MEKKKYCKEKYVETYSSSLPNGKYYLNEKVVYLPKTKAKKWKN